MFILFWHFIKVFKFITKYVISKSTLLLLYGLETHNNMNIHKYSCSQFSYLDKLSNETPSNNMEKFYKMYFYLSSDQ